MAWFISLFIQCGEKWQKLRNTIYTLQSLNINSIIERKLYFKYNSKLLQSTLQNNSSILQIHYNKNYTSDYKPKVFDKNKIIGINRRSLYRIYKDYLKWPYYNMKYN